MAFVVVVLVMTFLGLPVHLVAGLPARVILGPRADPALSAIARQQMDLDKPISTQACDFITHAFRGDLGRDCLSQLPVTSLIADVLPHTVVLALASLGLAVVLGVPLGVYAATRPGSIVDRIVGLVSVALITIPPYVAGLFLLLLFSVKLDVLPAIGSGSFSPPVAYLKHL